MDRTQAASDGGRCYGSRLSFSSAFAICIVAGFLACGGVFAAEASEAAEATPATETETAQASEPAVDSGHASWVQQLTADAKKFPNRFIEDTKDTFLERNNITALLMAGGASIAMHNTRADRSIQDDVDHHPQFRGFTDEALNWVGSPGAHFPIAGLWYVLAADSGDDLNRERALTMLTALSINGAMTLGLKAIRDNDTPNGKTWAWPSGHTSSSFCFAAVLDEFYGPKIGIPAYLLAGTVAYRMVDTGDHWTSDVIFGATLGWIVGHTVAGKHNDKLKEANMMIVPYAPPSEKGGGMGIGLAKFF